MSKVAAIMQPCFLPWMGYFSLIDQVDIFVFLDDVQFSKQSWQSRNRISGPNGPVLLSLPVARKPSKPLIRDTLLAEQPIRSSLLSRVAGSLERTCHWAIVESLLMRGLIAPHGLSDVNIGLIEMIVAELGLTVEFKKSSDLGVLPNEKSERLVEICDAVGATTYMSPVGSFGYLREKNSFDEERIRLRFLNFEHPVYVQRWGEFQSHMSIIDALAHIGSVETLRLIREGAGAPLTIEQALEVYGESI